MYNQTCGDAFSYSFEEFLAEEYARAETLGYCPSVRDFDQMLCGS